MSATKELLAAAEAAGDPEQEPDMISPPRDVFGDFSRLVAKKIGAKVVWRKPVDLSADGVSGGISRAEIVEWVMPGGEVVARKVTALGQVEVWLEKSLCTEVLIARADEEAERYRIIAEMKAHIERTRAEREQREIPALSSACVHAAVRHNSRIGRLWDSNSRGDRTRAQLAGALDRAVKAEASK